MNAEGQECAFIGDSASDVLARRLAGVTVIGYTDKPGGAAARPHQDFGSIDFNLTLSCMLWVFAPANR